MRVRTFTERMLNSDERIGLTKSDRVVAVRVRNQGTSGITTGWNSETAANRIEAGAADNFDAGDSGIIQGDLLIKFDSTGNNNAVVLLVKDIEEICE